MRAANPHAKLRKLLGYGAAAALLVLAPTAASAGKFKVLHSFCAKRGCSDGQTPLAPLVGDGAGDFFGTAYRGGVEDRGTAFELIDAGDGKYKFKLIYAFRSQQPNNGGLTVDIAGNLYGFDQAGNFYKLSYGFGAHHDKWGETLLSVGLPGATGSLTYAGASSGSPWDGSSPLYGVTGDGGQNGKGSVFSLVPNGNQWAVSDLYDFCSQQNCPDGEGPSGGLLLAASGQLYGTTVEGGTRGGGVAFQLSGSGDQWTESTLYNYCSQKNCSDGDSPFGNLAGDASGNLFGVTAAGGQCKRYPEGCGVLFQLSDTGGSWSETVLHRFCSERDCRDGSTPEGGVSLDDSGNLIGTTVSGGGHDIDGQGLGGGVVYKFSGGVFNVLHAFCAAANCADGERPYSNGIENSAGVLLGTASGGGAFQAGDVYAVQP
ncbi:MAG TPA: choice-of-anchor tandem repeat GloVer-containing protein [Rhizomicrobium sp.]|nr:choice-of-anchor tandem repeat GloVer-containing protein [Rhizomicrobium sp.]